MQEIHVSDKNISFSYLRLNRYLNEREQGWTQNIWPTSEYFLLSLGGEAMNIRSGSDYKVIILLSLGFGLVGLDRFMILPMFPVLRESLGIGYQDIGLITGILSIAWGISSVLMGNAADWLGRRVIVVASLIAFSLAVGLSGFAVGLLSLLFLRALIGLLEGAFAPAALMLNFEHSEPEHVGRNIGMMQAALPFFGLALAPIIVTQLLTVVAWHYVFAFLAIPGFLTALLLWRSLKRGGADPAELQAFRDETTVARWREALSYRNVKVNLFCICCWMACLIVTSALMPSYLMDYLHLDLARMGYVLSATGFGATLGGFVMPWLSDRIGRKTVASINALGTATFIILLSVLGPEPFPLFCALFGIAFFLYNLMGMTLGTMTAESVPAHIGATASGLVIGVGEIFGSGVIPIVAGFAAQHYGIRSILFIGLGATLIGLVALLGYRSNTVGQYSAEGRSATVAG
ncbi:MFS transporter [Mesorhizobium waimense]|uniref:MFS transporter n=1 Tax=Mesorhizobium waimense TaxID=1300307 RepID=A0A3A5L033_9HYPH|nr:MFS transporter [Mesorhizobium waimense]RJT41456.1 MFS transporter [Mesorhizobium waimense]